MTRKFLKSIAIFATVSILICSCSEYDITTTYTTSDCSAKTGVEKVVCLSHNFLASLSSSQQTSAIDIVNH
jgi:hypothetical protein